MSSRNPIRAGRQKAFDQQHGRCYYCDVRMWLHSASELTATVRSTEALGRLRCTAEHLLARCDGGTHAASNIVAACARCNHGRHRLRQPPDPPAYRAYVAMRVACRNWHQRWVYDRGLAPMLVCPARLENGHVVG